MASAYLTVNHLSMKDLTRIFSKISIKPDVQWNGTPCWIWTGHLIRGYGQISWKRKKQLIHRVLYAWLVAPLPRRVKGQKTTQLDHLCRHEPCGNPLHVELVPPRINTRRSNNPAAKHAVKTHCPQGHAYVEGNIYIYRKTGSRMCRTCTIARAAVRQHRQKGSRQKPLPKTT